MTRLPLRLLLPVAALLCAPAFAGETSPPSASVPLRLSLAEALRIGASRNLEVLAAAFDPAIACDDVEAERGAFDGLLTATVSGAHVETPNATIFSAASVIEENQVHADVGTSWKLRNGGTFAVVFRADRLFTTDSISTRNPRWTEGVSLEWTQPLLRGAGDVATAALRRAANGVRVARGGYDAAVDSVLLRIETAYWELVYADEQVRARAKAEEVAAGLLDVTTARAEARVATPLDVAEARAGVESRRGDRRTAEADRGRAEDALRALVLPFSGECGPPAPLLPTDDPRAPTPGTALVAGDDERLVRMALSRRPDLKALDADLENRAIDVAAARNEFLPQVDLFARVGTDGLDRTLAGTLEETLSGQALTGEIGVTLSVPFGRRTARARLRIAEYVRRQAEVRRREAASRVVEEVRGAARDLGSARARIASARVEIGAANESLEGERTKQKNGESTPFQVLQREEVATSAVTREGRAAADARIAEARLWRALGMLAEVRAVVAPATPPGR